MTGEKALGQKPEKKTFEILESVKNKKTKNQKTKNDQLQNVKNNFLGSFWVQFRAGPPIFWLFLILCFFWFCFCLRHSTLQYIKHYNIPRQREDQNFVWSAQTFEWSFL